MTTWPAAALSLTAAGVTFVVPSAHRGRTYVTVCVRCRVEAPGRARDRLVVGGRARISGTDMVWRQDTLKGLPLHATFCVTKDHEAALVEALDSLRALEESPETAALFASCTAPAPKKGKPTKRRR